MTFDQLATTNPGFANFVLFVYRYYAEAIFLGGFLTLAISLTAYRRGERWSWYAFWLLPITVVLQIIDEYSVAISPTYYVFLIVVLAGLILPYRKFFPKKQPITP
jgi:hypothetical protein